MSDSARVVRTLAGFVVAAVCAASTASSAGALTTAGPRPAFQLPFPCGDTIRMESFGHAPALDMFRVPNSETEGNPFVAAAAGVVNQSYNNPSGAGNIVQIDHGGGWFTTGIHLQSRAVSVGDRVRQGQLIGRVGHTGQTSNGVPHLHFEQAIDRNGDGRAEWGYPNNERVVQVFDGISYGRSNGETSYATSRNCGNRLDVFARGGQGQLVHKYFRSGSGWFDWEHLGGTLSSDPTAVSPPDSNRIDVFARGGQDQLVHRYYTGSAWSAWEHLGGELTSAPDASSWAPGRYDVFARGPANQLLHKWFDGASGWSDWEDLGGSLTSAPTAVAPQTGRIHIFARGSTNQLVHKWYDRSTGWSGWSDLGGHLTSGPDVASWGSGRYDVFARGVAGQLVHKWYASASGWSGWEDLGGTLSSDPGAVSWGYGRIDVFARGGQNQLVHKWFDRSSGWSDWEHLGGTLTSGPDASS